MSLLRVFFLISIGVFSGRIENNPQVERLRIGVRNAVIFLAIAPWLVFLVKFFSHSTIWATFVSFPLALLVVLTCYSARRTATVAWFSELIAAMGITIRRSEGENEQSLFELYWEGITYLLFHELVFLFYLPQLNLWQNSVFFPLFLIGGIVVVTFWPRGKTYRRIAATGIVILLTFHTLAVIPSSLWIKMWGSDPIATFRLTTVEDALAAAQSAEEEAKAKALADKINSAREKLAKGVLRKDLPVDERQALEQAEQGLIKKAWKGISAFEFPATIGGGGPKADDEKKAGGKLKKRVIEAAPIPTGPFYVSTPASCGYTGSS
jgi:hypothetical protein